MMLLEAWPEEGQSDVGFELPRRWKLKLESKMH